MSSLLVRFASLFSSTSPSQSPQNDKALTAPKPGTIPKNLQEEIIARLPTVLVGIVLDYARFSRQTLGDEDERIFNLFLRIIPAPCSIEDDEIVNWTPIERKIKSGSVCNYEIELYKKETSVSGLYLPQKIKMSFNRSLNYMEFFDDECTPYIKYLASQSTPKGLVLYNKIEKMQCAKFDPEDPKHVRLGTRDGATIGER